MNCETKLLWEHSHPVPAVPAYRKGSLFRPCSGARVRRVDDSIGSSGAARRAGGVKCSFISSAFPEVCALP